MTKLALRVKRRFSKQRGRNRAVRPKTFATPEAAKAWAQEKGLKDVVVESKGKKYVVN